VYERLVNGSIAKLKTKGSSRWREKTMMIACSSNPTYLYIISFTLSMGWSLHQMNVRTVLLNRVIEQEAYVEKSQGFEVYQKETLVCRWKKTLYGFK
jgi:hypothetical protein